MTCDDLFRFASTNLDPLTETYNIGFYLQYLSRWPSMCSMQEGASGRISSYMVGKAEGRASEWHGHVSALTVAPEFRRLGLAGTLMAELERVSEKDYNGFFVDLFVRVGNAVAVRLYASLGYTVYRRVLRYYGAGGGPDNPAEDAFDMRKRLARDTTGASVVPLPAPVTAEDILR
jgi:N-terminal acetyltransferase B complex catalytic subunit